MSDVNVSTAIINPEPASAMEEGEAALTNGGDKDVADQVVANEEGSSETVDKDDQPETTGDELDTNGTSHEPHDGSLVTDQNTKDPAENEPTVDKDQDAGTQQDSGDQEIENVVQGASVPEEPASPNEGPVEDNSSSQVPTADGLTAGGQDDHHTLEGPTADNLAAGEQDDHHTLEGPTADNLAAGEQDDHHTPEGPTADNLAAGEQDDHHTLEDDLTLEDSDSFLEKSHRPLSSVVPLDDIVEEEEEEDDVDRDELIQDVKEALADHNKLAALNSQLQHKIAEYLISRKKTEERADPGRNVTDQEKRYSQCMAALENLELEVREMQEMLQQQDAELKVHRDFTLAQVQQANAEFAAYKREKSSTAVSSRSGKKLSAQELDHYQSCEDKKEEGVIQVRLENIKLQNKIAKLEALIKQKEQLAEGLHMIDFEQLKINNVDLNEKIEERNEDILKLRKKVTSTVQVLTHVKEKLQFLQTENAEKRNKLKEMDSVVAKRRDHLTRMKQARDALRMDNIRLRQRGGLVAHSALLRDYEERKDQNEGLMSRLDILHQRHSELSVMCDGFRRKIEQARTVNTHHNM